jgi:STE24 endopeptidase
MLNAYGLFLLVALAAEHALSVVIDLLNVRAMGRTAPPGLADVYDAERYAKAQDYGRTRGRFAVLPRTFDLFLVLGFWLLGGFGVFDAAARTLGLGAVGTALSFLGALALGRALLFMPFQLYVTFVIEERFGFNRTTLATFAKDMLKGALLAVVLGAPVLSLLVLLFEHAGELAWLWAWAALTTLTLLLQFVAPVWIMPLFMKLTPLPDGELRTRILDYARSVAFPLENLFVVDGSRRSTKANAFFTGFGRHRRIGLFDTLIERHSVDELVAIVAHEVGHYKKRHVSWGIALSILQLGVMLFLFGYFMGQAGLYQALGVSEPSVHVGLLACSLLYRPIDLLLSPLLLLRSRRNEYEADRFAAQTTGLTGALVSGLKRLSADSLSNLSPHPSYVLLHYTHPPLGRRVAALTELGDDTRA